MRNVFLLFLLCFTIVLSKKVVPSSSSRYAPTKTDEEKDFDEGREEETEIIDHHATKKNTAPTLMSNNTAIEGPSEEAPKVEKDKNGASSSVWDRFKNVFGGGSKEAPLGSFSDGGEELRQDTEDNITLIDEAPTPEEDAREKFLFSNLVGGDDDGDDDGDINATSPMIHEHEEGSDDVLQKPPADLGDKDDRQVQPGNVMDVDDKELAEEEQEDEEEDEEREEEEEMGMMPIVQTKEDILKAEQREAAEEDDDDDLRYTNITRFDNEQMDDAEYSDTDDEDVREVTDDVAIQEARKEQQGSTSIFGGHLSPAAEEGEGTYKAGSTAISGSTTRNWAIAGTVVSSILLAAGSLMQKISSYDQSSVCNIPAIAGSVLVLIGVVVNAVICGLLPLTTIAVLNAQTVVAAHVIELLFMGVGFDVITAASIVMTTIGIVISVIASNQIDPEYTPADLSARMLHPGAIVNTVFFSVLVVICLHGCPRVMKRSISTDMTFLGEVFAGAVTAAMYTLLLKLVVEIIIYGCTYGSESLRPEAVFITFCFILIAVLAIIKVRIVSSSLKHYHVVLYTPIYQALSILLTAIFGISYLDEFEANRIAVADGSVVLYVVGIVFVLLGVGVSSVKFDPYVHVVDDDGDNSAVEKQGLMEEGEYDPNLDRATYTSSDSQRFRPIS